MLYPNSGLIGGKYTLAHSLLHSSYRCLFAWPDDDSGADLRSVLRPNSPLRPVTLAVLC